VPHTELKLAISKALLHAEVGPDDWRFLKELHEAVLAPDTIGISQWQSLRLSRIIRDLGIITPAWAMRRSS
jgi:hypothetical protein